MFKKPAALSALCLGALITGCASTQFSIKTKPPGANVVLINWEGEQKATTRSNTAHSIEIEEDYFNGTVQSTPIAAIITKENYLPKLHLYSVTRGGKNEDTPVVGLDKLNSTITLETDPPGAKMYFFESKEDAINFYKPSNRAQPKSFLEKDVVASLSKRYNNTRNINEILGDYLEDLDHSMVRKESNHIVTPFNQNYTSNAVTNEFSDLKVVVIEKDGYLPIIDEVSFKPGESNFYSFKLTPWSTKLTVIGDPEGIEVEDLRQGTSFGYLGSTPLIRPFNYDEVSGERKSDFWFGKKIKLALSASKAGYESKVFVVEIPFGEEITKRIVLEKLSDNISFQSEPPGAHVFVKRDITKEEYDSANDQMKEVTLTHWKHLGVTPFSYTQDPSDMLEHKDTLKFSLPGYEDGADSFKSSVSNYHLVLEPKGQIINSNEIGK